MRDNPDKTGIELVAGFIKRNRYDAKLGRIVRRNR